MVTAAGKFQGDRMCHQASAIADQDHFLRPVPALKLSEKLKTPTHSELEIGISGDSPDDILRNAALRSSWNSATTSCPMLRTWSSRQAMESRQAAITSLGRCKKITKDITKELSAYPSRATLSRSYVCPLRTGSARRRLRIPALESLLKTTSEHCNGSHHQDQIDA